MHSAQRIWGLALSLVLLGGCASQGGMSGAGGENPAAAGRGQTAATMTPATAGAGRQDAVPESMGAAGVASGAAMPVTVDPLEDPASPLAQRVIYFDFDRSTVREEFLDLIRAHADYLLSQPGRQITLEGHTDERGSREYNLALGEERAKAVRDLFLLEGVAAEQITLVSYGEERPAALGHDETSWQQNRRVVIVY